MKVPTLRKINSLQQDLNGEGTPKMKILELGCEETLESGNKSENWIKKIDFYGPTKLIEKQYYEDSENKRADADTDEDIIENPVKKF